MIDKDAWMKVITEPLGIVGFSLFLVFLLLSKKIARERNWLMPAFVVLAIISLVGGLSIAYKQTIPGNESTQTNTQPSIKIETHGNNSPAIGYSNAPVIINNTTDTSNE